MTEIVVIGGGIIGASATYRLARAGARVTLVEADHLAGGTSRSSYAWVNASDKPPFAYHMLNVSGMAEHVLLQQEFGAAPWLHLDGNLEWGTGDAGAAALAEKVTRLRAWGYAAEWLTRAEVHAREPEITLPPDVTRIACYPLEGYVDVTSLVGTLTYAARQTGAEIRPYCPVVEIRQTAGRVIGVVTASGERIAADWVISCTGRWSDTVAALAGISLPMANTVGMLGVTGTAPMRLRAMITAPGINVRPDGGGRFRIQATDFDGHFQPDSPRDPIPPEAYQTLDRAIAVVPGLAGAGLQAALIGVRAIPADGYPTVGAVPGIDGLYLVATHSGVTMGPLMGRIVAHEIVGGETDPRLATFRPARLITPQLVGG